MSDAHGKYPPAKEAAAEERHRQRKIVTQVLHLETEELFIGALRTLGLTEGSPGWEAALRTWRDSHYRY